MSGLDWPDKNSFKRLEVFAEAQGKKGAAGLIRRGSFSQLEIGGALLLPGEGGLQYFEEQPVVALLSIVLVRSIGIEQR